MTIAVLCQAGELETAYRQAKAALAERPHSAFSQADMHLVVLTCLKKYASQTDVRTSARWVRQLAALNLPPHPGRDEQLYWEMRKLLAALAKRQDPPLADIAELLRALPTVTVAVRPSLGRSVLLKAVLKFQEQLPAAWWAWWNLDLLRPEDYVKEPFTPPGEAKAIGLPALAETAFGAYAKSLEKQLLAATPDRPETRLAALALLPRLEALATEHPHYGWLPYRRAKLLLALGDTAAALPTLRPIVRQKSNEYWAWQLLAETLKPTDAAAALACYYRAAQCPSEELYLGKVRENLAAMLHGAGHFGLAQEQLRRLAQGKQAEGLAVSYTARLLMGQPWFAEVYAADKPTHSTLLDLAEQTTYGDLPWQPVVLQFIGPETPEKPAMARLLPAGEAARPLSVPLKKYQWLQKLPLGSPLQVRTETAAERPKIVQLAQRSEGQQWDTLPGYVAVINGFTPDKSLVFFTVRPDLGGAFRPAEFQLGNLTIGSVLHLRLQAREKEGETRQYVLAAEHSNAAPDARVCREFSGPLQLHALGFGFADDVYLPPTLISQRGWQAGVTISGQALMQHNKKKNKAEWSAVRID